MIDGIRFALFVSAAAILAVENVLAAMPPDVIWANGMEGGHVHGRDEVRSYWKPNGRSSIRMWSPSRSRPMAREVVVKVHRLVRDLKSNLLAVRSVMHVFQMRNGLIQRFDIRDE